MALTCWSESLQPVTDSTRPKRSFYKRSVWVGYHDHGPTTDVTIGGFAVDRTLASDSTIGTYNFGPGHLFRTGAGAGGFAGPGLGGVPANDFFTRAAHFFWRPLTFAVAFAIPSDDGIAGTSFLLQMGDVLYAPQSITTAAGIASPGGNSIGIFYDTADLAFKAINRGTVAGNRIVTDMSLTAVADTVYIAVINLLAASVNFAIYDSGGNLLSGSVSQSFASDFVATKPVTVAGGHIFAGTNTLSYPKIWIKNTAAGAKSFVMFWYYFEDTMITVPESLIIGT